jgi:hypothetical protein
MRGHSLGAAGILLALLTGTAGADNEKEVFFRFDSSELSPKAKAELAKAAARLADNPGAKLVLDAHADPRGTAPYNVGLSIRRAEAVRDQLVANGVDADDIILAHYGEDAPRRETFAQDRRVGLDLTHQPLYVIIDKALPTATAVTWERPATVAEIEGPRLDQTARR